MPKFAMPTKEGYYWAKLINPREGTSKPEHWGQTDDDLKSADWEVVYLYEDVNNHNPDEHWIVSVPGIEPFQWAIDFVWGPEVVKPKELL